MAVKRKPDYPMPRTALSLQTVSAIGIAPGANYPVAAFSIDACKCPSAGVIADDPLTRMPAIIERRLSLNMHDELRLALERTPAV